jgi:hypothetical protein
MEHNLIAFSQIPDDKFEFEATQVLEKFEDYSPTLFMLYYEVCSRGVKKHENLRKRVFSKWKRARESEIEREIQTRYADDRKFLIGVKHRFIEEQTQALDGGDAVRPPVKGKPKSSDEGQDVAPNRNSVRQRALCILKKCGSIGHEWKRLRGYPARYLSYINKKKVGYFITDNSAKSDTLNQKRNVVHIITSMHKDTYEFLIKYDGHFVVACKNWNLMPKVLVIPHNNISKMIEELGIHYEGGSINFRSCL